MRCLALLAFLVTMGSPALALGADFTVTNSGMTAYIVNGNSNAQLTLHRGKTYTFDVNAPGHPFFIKTARVTGSGSTWDEGVTNNGVTTGTLTFAVPADAPTFLFYQCGVHPPMGATVRIETPPAPATGALGLALLAIALGGAGILTHRRLTAA